MPTDSRSSPLWVAFIDQRVPSKDEYDAKRQDLKSGEGKAH